ncbi:hypothetical protein DFP74_3275 [Nocardiopsis sp. Huas11]|uniref:DUF6069 family protein n=1 Tax=Nocardiopsis sp. Huas11 TaxID=2183912 RepID=UPI000EB0D8EE|nr:DUF6069 family protein [Nocardiopsis sp. Huas11]RKS07597.1 hypothetical protein DFP74_3275 [Nocardiopsis sp. Huas11]
MTAKTTHTKTTHTSVPVVVGRPGSPWYLALPVAVAAVTVANLVLLGLGHLFGASMTHPDPSGAIVAVEAGGVVFMSAVPFAVGAAVAVVLSLAWKGFLRLGQVVGTVLAAASTVMPFFAQTDGGTIVVLALMHVTLAPAVWFGLGAVRRRALAG